MSHKVRSRNNSVYELRSLPIRSNGTTNCYVGVKYNDPIAHGDNCECSDADFEKAHGLSSCG